MPTAAERNSLLFLAAIALIGGGVRYAGTTRFSHELPHAERLTAGRESATMGDRALAAQINAVDSARRAGPPDRSRRRARAGSTRKPSARRTDSSFVSALPRPVTRKAQSRPPPTVDVNRATLAELQALPRVGPALAGRILEWREQHGPYRSLEDLRHVRGIGPGTLALLARSVTF